MKLKHIFNEIKYYIETYGFWKTVRKCFSKLKRIILRQDKFGSNMNLQVYAGWIKNHEPSEEELEEQRNHKFKVNPKISVVVPMYKTPIKFFEELVDCLINQTYENWELCLADGSPEKNEKLEPIIKKDKRIKYKFLNKNEGISGNTNEALKLVTGDFIALLDHDDTLPIFCLYELVKAINENPDVEFIYSDEDKIIGDTGVRNEPYFKPDFSPDTLRSNNYITHLSVFKKSLMDKLGGFRDEYNGAQDFDIILRATENTQKIVHIPKILYHWRIHQDSTAMAAGAKPYAYKAGQKASQDHIKRLGLKGTVSFREDAPGFYEVEYDVIGNPKVSILIPNKDGINWLKKCVNSILKLTTYKNYEIVVIENNSEKKETFEYYKELEKNEKIRILKYPDKGFNYSRIINFGVRNCDSEYVLQLNNDTELITPNWLEKFIGYCQREDVGAVGAKLYFKDKSIQHAGIVVGICGLAANMLTALPKGVHAYFGRECLIQNVSAVTGACLFAKRKIYEEVGYMDEENFVVAFNDVDFCLKIREKGYKIIFNPFIELMHYESKSRGYEDTPEKKARFERESNNFKAKWKDVIEKGDPYFNPNLNPNSVYYDIRLD